MTNLKDKVVVLTGASRGIGAATARSLAKDEPILILCARTKAANKKTITDVEKIGAKSENHGFDVSDPSQVNKFVDDIIERYGRIDVLINNAGTGKMGSVKDITPEEFLIVQKTNVMGPYNMIYASLPSMLTNDSGIIINLTSARAFIPDKFYAAYCSSKAALLSMTQCLHFDLKKTNVKIFAFSPGFTDTDMVREIYSNDEFRQAALTDSNGQSPERPAKVISWLAREAPEKLRGQHVQIQFNDISLRSGLEN